MLYLLHSDKKLGTRGSSSASHYLGFCMEQNLWQRLSEHQSHRSNVAIVEAFLRKGARLTLVRVWPGASRWDERRLKVGGHLKLYCPLCNPPNGSQPRTLQTVTPLSIPLSSLPRSVELTRITAGRPLVGTPLKTSGKFPVLQMLGGRIASGVVAGDVAHFPSMSRLSATARRSKVGATSSAGTSAPSSSGSTSGSTSKRSKGS